ncbi:SDR family oxidoreductase [Oscillibacter hominis]|uniref:SDR family oxidoreductase n=1 Tax=Oscillibacter hominis TaxID=2763056 RepID=A0A7G9B353_9FIRM|nr:SDR family oxidoreductase [Oscillibacter hominis]QNL43984.1 SDR family oxidoreductase [Oscillibacter hominis]
MEIQDKYLSLEGKVAIITGAGSGIGLAVSQLYVKYGAKVAMVDISDKCQEEADKIGDSAKFFKCNVSSEADVKATVEAVKAAFGRIDILVNNAGIIVRKTVLDTTEEEWDRCLDIGLKGVFLFSKHTVPIMIEQGGGVIVNTASGAAIKGVPDSAPYNAYKGGVAALTRGMAVDFGKYNIRVNCVCPGDIITPMLISEGIQTGKITTADPKTPEEKEAMEKFLESCGSYRPLRRIATAEQIAYTFLFLATDMSVYATGGSFVVDGGRCS